MNRDLDNVDTNDIAVKPIEEVLYTIKDIMNDIKTIRNDLSHIKFKLNQYDKQEKYKSENISKGWGYGFW